MSTLSEFGFYLYGQGEANEEFYAAKNIVRFLDFPGGPVVKNLACKAGDRGLIPGQGTKIPHAAEQLSLSHNY